MSPAAGANLVKHVFVLMLENRSFDHMVGFSGIRGLDAETSQLTTINGLTGTESNSFNGQNYPVSKSADRLMPCDPGHEFNSVLEQLCGPGSAYSPGGTYPPITCSGFVSSYVASGGGANPGEVMKCFAPDQLPVLITLAQEFVICDNWHASMPGPTWPNRMFVHAASSGGLDHSPTTAEIIGWEVLNGFSFKNGTIFDALKAKGVTRCLYAGDDFPMVAALKGIGLGDIRSYKDFATDLAQPDYPYDYVFIEPSYDVLNEYRNSTSQHPLTDVNLGEILIKNTYEAIRNSAIWNSSIFIITWDEHGGFYDHATPPAAVAPADSIAGSSHNQFGFNFEQYGPRVPAIVISPLIPRNLIDHRLYDHASIPATIEALFGINALTARDAKANSLHTLLTLASPRTDAPVALPTPSVSMAGVAATAGMGETTDLTALRIQNPDATVDQGNLPAILQSALRQDIQISPENRDEILRRVSTIKTREQARQYLAEVQQKVRKRRGPSALGTASSR
jgi:phospholipase C